MNKLVKLTSLALVFTFAFVALAACGEGKATAMNLSHVDVYTYVGNALSAKLTGTAVNGNKVSMVDGRLTVDVAANVTEVEFDLAPFFTNTTHAKLKGKDFYFTRSDVKVGATDKLVKGRAWVQTGGTATNRLYKQLGFESDLTKTAINKEAIAALENGATRMYIITEGTQAGKHVVYIDPTVTSSVSAGATHVNFKFHGHNGKKSELKVTVNKAAS